MTTSHPKFVFVFGSTIRETIGRPQRIALISLINDASECEVILKNGVVITQEEIVSFRKYVDENTKTPEIT